MTGKVDVKTERGYGFILSDSGEKFFFHSSNLEKGGVSFEDLALGQAVSFDTENGDKGPAAVNVKAV